MKLMPVMFWSGLASELVAPVPTGSPIASMTIGIVRVAFRAAPSATAPDVTITSTFCLTRSALIASRKSLSFSAEAYTISIVLPGT